LLAIAATRSVGWAIAWLLPGGRLLNTWVDLHDLHVLVGAMPLLVIDCYEHAYDIDQGVSKDGKEAYLEAVKANINWDVLEKRWMDQQTFFAKTTAR
jgi:Fe-Mn family superoxide dismutase